MRTMTRIDRAWVAAIIEGEGTFGHPARPCGRIRVVMTDRDVIQRLQDVTGLGLIHNRGRRLAHHKDAWDWLVTRRANVCALSEEIAPILLSRRRTSLEPAFLAMGRPMPDPVAMQPGPPESWAWIAGLIEGEGWISPGPNTVSRSPVVGVESTDIDVINRIAHLADAGRVIAIPNVPSGCKPRWRWAAHSRSDVWRVLTGILPLLGDRRTARAKYVLGVIGA